MNDLKVPGYTSDQLPAPVNGSQNYDAYVEHYISVTMWSQILWGVLLDYAHFYFFFPRKLVGTEYVYSITNQKVDGFWRYHDRKVNRIMKPLQNLLRVQNDGNLTFFIRSPIKPFKCPECFSTEYFPIQKAYKERDHANATIIL
jgi:hypothetical protein